MKIFISVSLFLITLFFVSVPAGADEILDPDHVLLLNSYDQRNIWQRDIVRGVEDVLEPDKSNIILHIENMDTKQFHSSGYLDAYRRLLGEKYRDSRFSLIFCSDNNAFDFLRQYGDSLFPGVPVVFCGVNDFSEDMIRDYPGFTGVEEVFSARNTVEMALSLHPGTTEVYIINDYLVTGRAWQRDMEKDLKPLEDRVNLVWSGNLPMALLQERVEGLPEDAIVLLGSFFADRDGRSLTYERVGAMISESSRVPVYCLLEFNIGRGAVGGEVISGYFQGEAMARIGKRVLSGEKPAEIPVIREGVNRIIFDYRQLERFGLRPGDLPEGSMVINRPYSVYREYEKEIWAVLIMISVLLTAVIFLAVNILRRTRAEAALRESEKRFRQLADATWEGILIHERGVALQVNDMFLSMFGYSREEILGREILPRIVAPGSRELVAKRIASEDTAPYEAVGMKKDGSVFPVEVRLRLMDYHGRPVRVAAVRDMTEQKKMEERLTQSQKMQAIGTLAGGIAHDFNNILSAVIGYADLGLLKAEQGSVQYSYFGQIMTAGKRARELVQQILAFSRQSKTVKQSVHVGTIVKETSDMLRASIPTTIEIRTDISTDACVMADPVQLQQIVMNLCTNAGHAMRESGGILEILVKDVELGSNSRLVDPDLRPGRYVRLIVSDTGCGMSEEVRSRIFDPFYTTREKGEGTGMGLSVVHGIVTGMSGAVTVYSSPGKGSAFNLFLPACYMTEEQIAPEENIRGGTERILFVDDESFQVELGQEVLGTLGYRVTAVTNSEEALELFRAQPDAFDLLITDVTMPGMTGDVLVEKIHEIRPGLPVVICTGYSERMSRSRLRDIGVREFVMKPMLLRETAQKVRSALDAGAV